MKIVKYILIVEVLILSAFHAYGKDLTPRQKAFQSSIMQFLKEEGFSPKIDDVNDLTFKKEGNLYWIEISDNSPIYIELHRLGLSCENADMDVVLEACNHANKTIKCIKAIMGTTSVSLAVELYCHSEEEFKYIFYKNLSSLDDGYDALKDYYDGHKNATTSSAPFALNSVSVANVKKDGTIINDYGTRIYDYQTMYIKPRIKVKVNTSGTYTIKVKFFTSDGMSTGTSSPSGFSYSNRITMSQGNHYYYLDGWGNANAGNWEKGDYRLEFYYGNRRIGNYSFTIY